LVAHLPLTSLGKGYLVVGLQCNLQMLRTNQMKMGKIHATYHAWKSVHTSHIEIAKALML